MGLTKCFSCTFLALIVPTLAFGGLFRGAEKSPFTIHDYFDVKNLVVSDMTKDAEWLACQITTPGDRMAIDNTRFGDPTYTYPFRCETIVLNVRTGKQIKLFAASEQVESLAWSPNKRMIDWYDIYLKFEKKPSPQ